MSLIENHITKHRFFEVLCTEGKIRSGVLIGNPCRHWLGYVQLDTPGMSLFYCRECNLVYTFLVDEEEIVHVKVKKNENRRIGVNESVVVINESF